MKKCLIILLACLALVLSVGCGATESESGGVNTTNGTESDGVNTAARAENGGEATVTGSESDGENEVDKPSEYDYGVFLGAEPEDIPKMESYKTIVVEGQLYTAEQVAALKENGHTVLSYINVGAVEEYRSYYSDYEKYTLDVYENWEDEKWVDVSAAEWKSFVTDTLARELYEKGFDGLFVDNLDVYYHYQSEENFEAITSILTKFKEYGFYVSINGGDVYVTECMKRFDDVKTLFDAVNQETVFSKINWNKKDSFGTQKKSETEYFTEYLEEVSRHGIDVYLLEYTRDMELTKKIESFSNEKGYHYYISPKLNLEAE